MHHWRCSPNRHIWRNSTITITATRSHLTLVHPFPPPSPPRHTLSVHHYYTSPSRPLRVSALSPSPSSSPSPTPNHRRASTMATPDITLYTNHACPWAQRAHIALKELGLPFKEEIIDLDRPRDPWYLEINPRGLVPTIKYNGHIITESATVAQFLADTHPTHNLLPPSSTSEADALFRARVGFFVDTFISKALPQIFNGWRAQAAEERDVAANEIVNIIAKEVEPLFDWDVAGGKGGPYFGGSQKPTLAEVQTAPFVLRLIAFTKPEYEILSPKIDELLKEKAPRFLAWATKLVQEESVTYSFDEKLIATRTKERFAKLAAAAKV